MLSMRECSHKRLRLYSIAGRRTSNETDSASQKIEVRDVFAACVLALLTCVSTRIHAYTPSHTHTQRTVGCLRILRRLRFRCKEPSHREGPRREVCVQTCGHGAWMSGVLCSEVLHCV